MRRRSSGWIAGLALLLGCGEAGFSFGQLQAGEGEDPDDLAAARGCVVEGQGLGWPIACAPGDACWRGIGTPDVDGDGIGFDCEPAGYVGHTGSDIRVSEAAMLEGVPVLAAAAGQVVFVRDDRHDRCDVDVAHPDCVDPPEDWAEPGQAYGNKACTLESETYCTEDSEYERCMWCFRGGNTIVIRHFDDPIVYATIYAHLRKGSALVEEGDRVGAGRAIGLVGSAGNSSGPHLHFDVWDHHLGKLEPWNGPCSPAGQEEDLFATDPAWCLGADEP